MRNVEESLTPFRLSFPVEVQEHVIDRSAVDVLTLRNCALTCRVWLPRSRLHLFSTIRISTQEDIYSFCDLLDAEPDRRMMVRSITMVANVCEKRSSCLLETFPVQLLSRLPNLRGWALRVASDRIFNVSYHPITLKQLRISSPIVNLCLESLRFLSDMEFLRYITSFTRLKHLCCDTIFIQRCSTDPGGRLKPHGIGALRLSTLHVRKIPQDLIHALLDRTASTLESLTIASGQDVNGLSLLLSQMSRLHSLTFDIFRPRSTTSIIGGWGMVAKSLSNATIPTLSSLRVNLYEDMLQWHTAYSNTTLRPDSDINAISSFILTMKLPSFTIDIRAHFGTWHGVQPIRSTFKLMGIKLFADLCDHGLPPLVVYSGATFADEVLVARSIALSPDGERVAGLNVDGNIILWNISDDPSVRTWGLARPSPNPISSIVFSPDSARLLIVTPKNTAYICDVKRGHRLTTIACDPIVGAWSPRCIAFTTHARTISTWDPFTYQPIQDYALGGWPLSPNGSERRVEEDHNPGLLFSPDHRWLAASYPVRFSLWSNGYAWVLWRVTDRGGLTDPTSLPLPSGPFGPGTLDYYGHLVAFNLECTRMAVVGYGLKLHVWDVATATLFLVIDMATTCAGEIRGNIAFSADGRCLLVLRGGKDTVEVWDTTAGYLLNPLVLEGKGNGKPSTSESLWRATRFSPCGRYLISSPSNTGGVMVWKTTDGSLVRRIS